MTTTRATFTVIIATAFDAAGALLPAMHTVSATRATRPAAFAAALSRLADAVQAETCGTRAGGLCEIETLYRLAVDGMRPGGCPHVEVADGGRCYRVEITRNAPALPPAPADDCDPAETVTLPAHWACYLINGDASGLNDGEAEAIDAYLSSSALGTASVVDVIEGSQRFTWSFESFGGDAKGGDVADFTVIMHPASDAPPALTARQPSQQLQADASTAVHPIYNTTMFPHFICHHGKWDIYANEKGFCASIPTRAAAAIGCRATHFGDAGYVRATLGVTVMVPQQAQQPQADASRFGGPVHAEAAGWLAYVSAHAAGAGSVAAFDAAVTEAVDTLLRRQSITPRVAACLLAFFDAPQSPVIAATVAAARMSPVSAPLTARQPSQQPQARHSAPPQIGPTVYDAAASAYRRAVHAIYPRTQGKAWAPPVVVEMPTLDDISRAVAAIRAREVL